MRKYQNFLGIKHSWQGINCLSLIDKIYLEYLAIEFMPETLNRVGIASDYSQVDRNWFKNLLSMDEFANELENWEKVPLTHAQEFDILVFTNAKGVPVHFGMYIGQNHFIHVHEESYSTVSLLDDYYRKMLNYKDTRGGVYRHGELVRQV